jgi:hypothetical protein
VGARWMAGWQIAMTTTTEIRRPAATVAAATVAFGWTGAAAPAAAGRTSREITEHEADIFRRFIFEGRDEGAVGLGGRERVDALRDGSGASRGGRAGCGRGGSGGRRAAKRMELAGKRKDFASLVSLCRFLEPDPSHGITQSGWETSGSRYHQPGTQAAAKRERQAKEEGLRRKGGTL